MREIKLSEISLICIIRDIMLNLWVVLLCVLIAVMGSDVVLKYIYTPSYSSSVTYYVSPKDSTNSAYSNLNNSSQMASVLVEVFASDIMREKVTEALGLTSLEGSIYAEVLSKTNLLRVTAIAGSPQTAFSTINAVLENQTQVSSYVFDDVVMDVLVYPTVPESPIATVELLTAQKQSAAIAAVLALIIIVFFSVMRDTVKTEDTLRNRIDAPIFATLKHETKNKTLRSKLQNINHSVLITNPVTGFSYTEAIKRMCTKLEYVAGLRGHKTYLIASASENEGKSTVSVNLAMGLAMRGYKVLLIDSDLRKPSQNKLLSIPKENVNDFARYLRGKATLEEVLRFDEKTGLYLLLNHHSYSNSADLISSPQMTSLITRCRRQMDYIIIDSPPASVASDTEAIVNQSDAALLVVRQDFSYIATINDTVDKLQGCDLLGCVFNDVRSMTGGSSYYARQYGHYYSPKQNVLS